MTKQSYKKGFQDGWFFDEKEITDSDYISGLCDGKEARIKSEHAKMEIAFREKQSYKKGIETLKNKPGRIYGDAFKFK